MKLWVAVPLVIGLGAACSPPQTLPSYVRQDLANQWTSCGLTWPPDSGFAAAPVLLELEPGTLIDRFGGTGGNYFSPVGASYGSRALPYVCTDEAYTVYRVLVPLPVEAGTAAPWFAEPGGATQFKTDATAAVLLSDGELAIVRTVAVGAPDTDKRCD